MPSDVVSVAGHNLVVENGRLRELLRDTYAAWARDPVPMSLRADLSDDFRRIGARIEGLLGGEGR